MTDLLLYTGLMIQEAVLPCYRLKPLILRLTGNRGETGPSAVAPGPLEVNWWLRKHTEEEKPLGRSSGPGQIPRGVNMEALRASLCWCEKEPLVFPPSLRKMGSDPQDPPPPPAWQLNSSGRSAEPREIPADVRAALNGRACPPPPAPATLLFPRYSVN